MQFIKRAGLTVFPEAAFESISTPKSTGQAAFYEQALPILFAASMDQRFEKSALDVAKALRANSKELIGPFSKPSGNEYTTLQLDAYVARVSYGCLELSKGDFSTMVKASWASARYYCDFSEPKGP